MTATHVVKKEGVLIPKRVIKHLGLKEGDQLRFEAEDDAIRVVKVSPRKVDKTRLMRTIKNFAGDLKKIRPYIEEAEEGLIEGFSRHLGAER